VGCWALLQGLFVIARIADSGAGTNLTRRYAILYRRHGRASPWPLLAAGAVLASLPVAILGCAVFLPIVQYIAAQYSGQISTATIRSLAVWCLVFGVLMSVATLSMSVCDGAQRIVSRNLGVIAGNLASALSVLPLWTRIGPSAIGAAYVISALVPLVVSLGILVRLTPRRAAVVRTTFRELLRQMWAENLELNVMALTRLSFEPATKFFLSLVAPLGLLASVDLAMKISTQLRVLMQAALQPLLSAGAHEEQSINAATSAKFRGAQSFLGVACRLGLVMTICVAPAVAWLAFGDPNRPAFEIAFVMLVAANVVNALGLVGYVFQLSSGNFRPLVAIQIRMALLNAVIGAAGWLTGSWVVVVAGYGCAFGYGGMACLRFWALHSGESVGRHLRGNLTGGVILGVFIGIASMVTAHRMSDGGVTVWASLSLAGISIAATSDWTAVRRLTFGRQDPVDISREDIR